MNKPKGDQENKSRDDNPHERGMLLSASELDALSELINIGFGRAASALSTLVGRRILLEAPQVNIYPVDELMKILENLGEKEITNVHQIFSGKLTGDAMLLMDSDSASILIDLMAGGSGNVHPMTAVDRESLVETGNILLNAFIGTFGNLLRVHITFTVPRLKIETVPNMISSIATETHEIEYALVVKINFRLAQGNVSGYMVIIMGIHSLEVLVEAMKSEGYIL
jgi:chemotaxis protein CheC